MNNQFSFPDGTDCTMDERKSDAEAAARQAFTPFVFPPHPPIPVQTTTRQMTGDLRSTQHNNTNDYSTTTGCCRSSKLSRF